MKKGVLYLIAVFLVLVLCFFVGQESHPAYAADTISILNFHGEIEAYDTLGNRIMNPLLQYDHIAINIDSDNNNFNDVYEMRFYPKSEKLYEYKLNNEKFFKPLSYGQVLKNVNFLTVKEVDLYNVLFREVNITKKVYKDKFIAPPEALNKEGCNFLGWKEEGQDSFFSFTGTPIQKDYVFVPIFEKIISLYNVIFSFENGSTSTFTVNEGIFTEEVPVAELEGHKFLGWQEEGQEGIFSFTNTTIQKDYVFMPIFEKIILQYNVVFLFENGDTLTFTVSEGRLTEEVPVAELEGYSFLGWKEEGQEGIFSFAHTPIEKDYFFYPVFIPQTKIYTFTFTIDGIAIATREVAEGSVLSDLPSHKEKHLHTFLGWAAEGTETIFNFSSTVNNNMVFVAKYQKTSVLVTFLQDSGSHISIIECGKTVEYPLIAPKVGYNSIWHYNGILFNFETPIYEDITLTASYTIIICKVYFEIGEGILNSEPNSVNAKVPYGEDAAPPKFLPPTGYTFKSWSASLNNITEDITIYAIYAPIICQVSFYIDDSCLNSATHAYGIVITEPTLGNFEIAAPDGHYLYGWSITAGSDVAYDFSKAITSSINFYAILKRNSYKINFYDDKSLLTDSCYQIEVLYGDTFQLPEAPYKANAVFECWSINLSLSIPYNIQNAVTNEISLYAKYRAINYTISIEVSEGINITLNSLYPNAGDRVSFSYTLPDGYILTEKCVTANDETINLDCDSFIMPYSDVLIKLILSEEKYNIKVFVEDSLAATLPYGEDFVPNLLQPPEHYLFSGWYTDKAATNAYNGRVIASYGDAIYLYPKLEKKVYKITFLYGYGNTEANIADTIYGDIPVPPTVLSGEYIAFTGWDKSIAVAECDTVYKAKYKLIFDIFYYDGDKLLHTVKGELNTLYQPPTKEGCTFVGFVLQSIDYDTHTAIYNSIYTPIPPVIGGETENPKPYEPDFPVNPNPEDKEIDNTINPSEELQNFVLTASKIEFVVLFAYVFALWQLLNGFIKFLSKRKDPVSNLSHES